MRRPSTFAVLLWVIAVAILPVRMANAHLHFCLDGQSAPISVHVDDVPTHAPGSHDAGGHNDRDVNYSASLLTAKHTSHTAAHDLGFITAYVVAILLPIERTIESFAALALPNSASVFSLRPPMRGPPR